MAVCTAKAVFFGAGAVAGAVCIAKAVVFWGRSGGQGCCHALRMQ